MAFTALAGARFPESLGAPGARLNTEAVKQAAIAQAEELFRLAWGEPANPRARQWRAKQSSALAMWMHGPKRGLWHDFKRGIGGDIFELVAVELLGLARAADDFPRVLDETARLIGFDADTAPSAAELQALRQEKLRASQKAEDEKRARDATLVAALQKKAQNAAQSPAQAYLRGRGIDALPADGIAYLPPVPGVPVKHPQRAALVVWAKDDAGRVMGGQRILICEDGSKAPEEPRKPSFGSIAGYPARFPQCRDATPGGKASPLYIAEGPETALAIWQATGAEVWAVFGADFFAKAPAPLGRPVILCPDCDAPGSPAAQAFQRGCEALFARGCEVWIARAPEPEGSKRDFADTLQERGPEAVAKALANAVRFTPRDAAGRFTGAGAVEAEPVAVPDFLELEDAQALIRAEVAAFLQEAKAWDAMPAELRGPAPVLAIAATPSVGKTRITTRELGRLDLNGLSGDVVFYAPTLALAEESAITAQTVGLSGHITRGRSAINPATGEPMCKRWREAELVARAGLPVRATLCERVNDDGVRERCPHHSRCAYLQQWAGLGNAPVVRHEASAYLALASDGSGRKTSIRVTDESVWRLFTRKGDIPLDKWLRPRKPRTVKPAKAEVFPILAESDAAHAKRLADRVTKAARDVLAVLEQGQSLQSLPYTPAEYRSFAKHEREAVPALAIGPASADEDIRQALEAFDKQERRAGTFAAVWDILAECAERGIARSERLRIVRDAPSPGTGEPRDVLRVCWLAMPPRDKPTLLLDADADAEIIDRLFPGARLVRADVRPNAEVIQVADRTFAKGKLLERADTRAELRALIRAEVLRDRLQGGRGVLVVCTKAVARQFFEDAGYSFEGMDRRAVANFMQETPLHGARWLWFGPAALGRNDWRDFGTAIIIGREELPPEALEDYLRALGGDCERPLELVQPDARGNVILPEQLASYCMADGSGRAVRVRMHPDRLGKALQMQSRELGTRQAYERLRLATAKQRKRVVIACKVPIPGLPVDKLVSWQDLMPSRAEAAMAEAAQRGGVLRLSAAGLAQDAPDTFPSQKAAARWLEKGGGAELNTPPPVIGYSTTGEGVFRPTRITLRLKGQTGRATPALVVLPGDVRAMAEAQFGPLAELELEAGSQAEAGQVSPETERPPAGFPDPEAARQSGGAILAFPMHRLSSQDTARLHIWRARADFSLSRARAKTLAREIPQ